MQSALQPGTTLQNGKYIIKRVLGQGGFGITYLAEHSLLGTDVAIKEFFMSNCCYREEHSSCVYVGIHSIQQQVAHQCEKFKKEARVIARLRHPNIVHIQDIFDENGTAYYVMDYCDNGSLSDLIKENPNGIDEATALKYIRQVATTLRYIHSQKINHLDIKPANIMIDFQGNAVLIDFGGAKQYDFETGEAYSLTSQLYSDGYAPIEQQAKGGVGMFSPATDIYALGATFFKLITGMTPPPANVILNDGLPPIYASAPVAAAIKAAMQPKRKDRPQSIDEWLTLLDSANAGPTYKAHTANPANYHKKKQTDEATVMLDNGKTMPSAKPKTETRPKTKKKLILAISAILLTIISVFIFKSYQYTGTINDHRWVDLGLSVKWASCNVGASSPEDYGDYFAWGETSSKSSYSSKNYKERNLTLVTSNNGHDAARENWGGSWRMPSKSEFEELIDNCTWKWTKQGDHYGYKVTSKINDKSIFLPAAGCRRDSSIDNEGTSGTYWTATPGIGSRNPYYAFYLHFYNRDQGVGDYSRVLGLNIRPVTK